MEKYIKGVYFYDIKSSKELANYNPLDPTGKLHKHLQMEFLSIASKQQQLFKGQTPEISRGSIPSQALESCSIHFRAKETLIGICTSNQMNQKQAQEVLDEIDKQNIPKFIGRDGSISNVSKQNLQYLLDKQQEQVRSLGKFQSIREEISSATSTMKTNLQKAVSNMDDMVVLEDKSSKIRDSSMLFMRDSSNLSRIARCKRYKMLIIAGAAALVVIVFLIYSFMS